ncbi:peptidase domain-containing ABC transporter [Ferrovum sp. PN-J185]|uniref:peptidase domain-containing ABC transporter n=1 Tax=Ferrovum sp. PN-J185 TaxID=1356306 RepID=UPI000796E71F|nr:ATP-binding cassette domain-containing protein [Ferrovum sp. PN-J185]KXW56976.1 alpha-hemolysin translocation ATP-binding protein HlyB [Ferrovum sp. PN-J185]
MKKNNTKNNPTTLILDTMSPLKEDRVWIILSSLIISILALATPLIMLQVYDRILANGSLETLKILMSGTIIAVVFESLIKIIRSHISSWIAARFEHRAMTAITSRLLAMPLHDFEMVGIGVHNEYYKAVQSLKSYYSGQTFQNLIDVPFTFLYILVMALINVYMGLLVLFGYLIFFIVVWKTNFKYDQTVKDKNQIDLRRTNFLAETLGNIHTLKSMGMEILMLRRYEKLQETSAKSMQNLSFAMDIALNLGTVFSPLLNMLVITLGAYFVITTKMTTGDLAACLLLSGRSISPIQRLGGIWTKHKQEKIMRDELNQVLSKKPLPNSLDLVKPEVLHGQLELKNISYIFPKSDKPIFENISLKISYGETICIHGVTGSGRTTLMQIIAGLIKPTSGTVTYENIPLENIGATNLQNIISYLPQRSQLFEGTLIENISLYDDKKIGIALEKANTLKLGEFVSKLPKGWDSKVGDTAVEGMPPGFRQRISLVKGLTNDPEIILFDDATSSIDAEGEKLVIEYLQSAKKTKSIIIVTQRPSIQNLADIHYTLINGKLIPGKVNQNDSNVSNIVNSHLFSNETIHQPITIEDWKRIDLSIQSTFRKSNSLSSSLPELLKALGWRRSARELVESLPYFQDSFTIPMFENSMAQLGFLPHKINCNISEIDGRQTPCLFITNSNEAYVIYEINDNKIKIKRNINSGFEILTNYDESGIAYFFTKNKLVDSNNKFSTWIKTSTLRFRSLILYSGISSILSGLVLVVSSLFMMSIYNNIIPAGSIGILFNLAFGVLLALLSSTILIVHRAKILSYIAARIEYLFGTAIIRHIFSLSPILSERASVGSQLARISGFEAIRDLFTGPLASTMLEIPATIVVAIALGIINHYALIVLVVTVLTYFILYWTLEPYSSKLVFESGINSTKRNQFTIEMITKMRSIKESGGDFIWFKRFKEISAEATISAYKTEKLSATLVGLSYLIMMVSGLSIITITVPYTLDKTLGPGVLVASMFFMWRVLNPLQILFVNMPRIDRIKTAGKQLESLMNIQAERFETTTSPISRDLKGQVQFSRVSFRYSLNVDPALIGADFTVKPGEVVAISGPNGGGKSTILKLLLGMYPPQAGAILIDGVDIRQLDPLELRRFFGYAPQDTQFFRATISQNLRLAKPDATDYEIKQVLEWAGALEQVEKLPNGLNYRIGDNTSEQLPASLRQKLILARAYITDAPIMLFDEPGAGLDEIGNNKFIETISYFKGRKTVIFITHRPSHMRLADTLIVMQQGYIRAAGSPEALLKVQPAA